MGRQGQRTRTNKGNVMESQNEQSADSPSDNLEDETSKPDSDGQKQDSICLKECGN